LILPGLRLQQGALSTSFFGKMIAQNHRCQNKPGGQATGQFKKGQVAADNDKSWKRTITAPAICPTAGRNTNHGAISLASHQNPNTYLY